MIAKNTNFETPRFCLNNTDTLKRNSDKSHFAQKKFGLLLSNMAEK